MDLVKGNIIGELVAENYRAAGVFKKYGIDFCCQGNRTIDDACTTQNLDSESLIKDLSEVINQKAEGTVDYKSWPLDLLVDYIEKKHHRYVEEKINEITPYVAKIAKVHGDNHPELIEINESFISCTEALASHMKEEEQILFPYVREIVKAKLENLPFAKPSFSTIESPIETLMTEHNAEGERFRKIAELSNNYQAPADGCNTYKVTFALLKEFEEDLHLHIHLESNIVFPEILKLEKEIFNA